MNHTNKVHRYKIPVKFILSHTKEVPDLFSWWTGCSISGIFSPRSSVVKEREKFGMRVSDREGPSSSSPFFLLSWYSANGADVTSVHEGKLTWYCARPSSRVGESWRYIALADLGVFDCYSLCVRCLTVAYIFPQKTFKSSAISWMMITSWLSISY